MPPESAVTNKNQWIFKDLKSEFLWLYLPGILGLALCSLIPEGPNKAYYFFGFLTLGVIDNGHVFSTVWRTYFNPSERVRSRMYLWAPIAFTLFFLVMYAKLSLFVFMVTVVNYARVYHALRQFFGISKWHQRINGTIRQTSDRFFYLLCLVPILIGSTRSEPEWQALPIYHFPNPVLHSALSAAYAVIVLAWIVYEIGVWRKSRELNRVMFLAYSGFIFSFGYLGTPSAAYSAFPAIIAHGVGYFGLTNIALRRTGSPLISRSWSPFALFLLPAIVGSVVFGMTYMFPSIPLVTLIGTALGASAFFCHQLFDSFIWKGKHPEATQIYRIDSSPQTEGRVRGAS
jgi:hypothetical protein